MLWNLQRKMSRFQISKTVEIMLAIDPDTAPDEAESSEDERKEPEEIGKAPEWYLDTFDPFEPDVAKATSIAAHPALVEVSELIARGRAPPAWRRDDFLAIGPVRRSVYTPPYSIRPPDKEPEEELLSVNQKTKDELREKLKFGDPERFAAQELRHNKNISKYF